jgi:hypothetical protein
MTDKNKATSGSPNDSKQNSTEFTRITAETATGRAASQNERVLLAMLHLGSLNCQEAEKQPIKARHLNSVISELANRHQLQINREREQVPGYCGELCHLIRYSVIPDQIQPAIALLNQWRAKRHAPPVTPETLKTAPLGKMLAVSGLFYVRDNTAGGRIVAGPFKTAAQAKQHQQEGTSVFYENWLDNEGAA